MDMFYAQSQQNHQNQHNNVTKKRLTRDQVMLLERNFTTTKKLDPEMKQQLADQLGVPQRQVAIWYQNKRARWRAQTLELDYNTIQVKLDHVSVENQRLEKEVARLKDELRKANDMMFGFNCQGGYAQVAPLGSQATQPVSHALNDSSNSYCDDGTSSFDQDTNGNILQWQLDELYQRLIGGNESSFGDDQDCNFSWHD